MLLLDVFGVESDAYCVAPSPILYVIGADLTVLDTLEDAHPVTTNPSETAVKPIITCFTLILTSTIICVLVWHRVTIQTCLGKRFQSS